jgi:hypothetical protein
VNISPNVVIYDPQIAKLFVITQKIDHQCIQVAFALLGAGAPEDGGFIPR